MRMIIVITLLYTTLANICDAGYACIGNRVLPCPAGTYTNIGDGNSGTCKQCTAGFYCPNALAEIPCPDSTPYSIEGTSNTCTSSCPAGSYCYRTLPQACTLGYVPTTDKLTCRPCSAGNYCPDHVNELACPAGTYSTIAQPYCTICPAGSYCPSTTGFPLPCPAGYYSLGNSVVCTICTKGYNCPNTDRKPWQCEEGYYTNMEGQTSCFQTPAGYYVSNYIDLTRCGDGTFSQGRALSCRSCPAGFECKTMDIQPTLCDGGKYSTGGWRFCSFCPTGFYCATLNLAPVACAANTFSKYGNLRCYPCPPGYDCTSNFEEPCQTGQYTLISSFTCYNSTAGNMARITTESPLSCITGTYSLYRWTYCVECPIGTKCSTTSASPVNCLASNYEYSSGQATACTGTTNGYHYIGTSVLPIRCLPGTYQVSDKTQCMVSPQGSIVDQPTSTPTACTTGTFSPIGNSWCQPCPYGYYCIDQIAEHMNICLVGQHSTESSTSCTTCADGNACPTLYTTDIYTCPLGTYSVARDGICRLCPAGYHCIGTGLNAPTLCNAGTFATEGYISSNKCTLCQLGKQCPFRYLQFVEDCWIGMYTPTLNTTNCQPCPLGKRCENKETATACLANEYSLPGDHLCRQCPGGYTCSGSTTAGWPQPCQRGYYSTEGDNSCVICPKGYYCPKASQFPIPCPPSYYQDTQGSTVCKKCSITQYTGYAAQSCTTLDDGYEAIYNGAPNYACSAGYIAEHSNRGWACVPCTPGYYCNSKANVTKQTCPSGYYCNTVEGPTILISGLHPCPPGTYPLTSPSSPYHIYGSCQDCTPGYYCTGGNANRVLCPDGYYCPARTRYSHEFPCPAGMKSLATGTRSTLANSCQDCGSGNVCYEGTVTAFLCPPEYSCSSTRVPYLSLNLKCGEGRYGSSNCGLCDAGFFCPYGAYLPYKCPPGTFLDTTGKIRKEDCTLCTQGYACPYFGMTTSDLILCKKGCYCPTGTITMDQYPLIPGTFHYNTIYSVLTIDTVNASVTTTQAVSYFGITAISTSPTPLVCPEGKACYEGTDQNNIEDCPIGRYCSGGIINKAQEGYYIEIRGASSTASQIICPAGYYCPEGTERPKLECFEGYYCEAGAKRGDQSPCPEGMWSNKRGLKASTECTSCSPGYYCPIASKVQYKCPIGTFKTASGGGISACVSCTAGYKCPTEGLVNAIICGKGYYSFLKSTVCFDCPVGYSCPLDATDISQKVACTAGQWCNANTGIPPLCPIGYYCPAATLVPMPCPAGKYRDTQGAGVDTDCIVTPQGQYSHIGAAAGEGLCDPGYFCPNGSFNSKQLPCSGGSYRNKPGAQLQADCAGCPAGSYCPSGTAIPIICPQGYYCIDNQSEPTLCPKGTYGANVGLVSLISCTYCSEGRYCSQKGLRSPDGMCDQGFYCPTASTKSNAQVCEQGGYCDAGSVVRSSCPPGRYNPNTGGRDLYACKFCDPGKSCSGTNANNVTGGCDEGFYCPRGSKTPKETACEPGYYCPANSSDPTPCIVGQYNPYFQQTKCLDCPAGFYCTSVGNADVFIDCPIGNYCPAGSASPSPCPIGTYNPNKFMTASTDCLTCPGGYYCGSVGRSTPSGKCSDGYWCKSSSTESAPSSQNANFGPCTTGHYCLSGFISPMECPQGTYQDLASQSTCKDCPSTKYCRSSGLIAPEGTCLGGYICNSTKNISPKPYASFCSAGYYCTAGAAIQLECVAGTYQPNIKQASCITCPSGYYCPTTGSGITTKTICPVGSYCAAGSSNFKNCVAGTYNPRTLADKVELCLPCDPGKYCNADGLQAVTGDCTSGYYCTGGSITSMQNTCQIGYYCPIGSSRQLKCPPGYFCPVSGMYDTNVTGAGDVKNYNNKKCTAGYYCLGQTSVSNPADETNQFGNGCPKGYYCPLGSRYKIPCPPGTYNAATLKAALTDCLVCAGGYYCKGYANIALSTLCDSGYDCSVAPSATIGYITSNPISAICPVGKNCNNGAAAVNCTWDNISGTKNIQIQLLRGKSACDNCPPGFYCPDTVTKIMCDPSKEGANYYCPEKTNKKACLDGYYNVVPGSSSINDCTLCPPGQYCPATPADKDHKIIPCDAGYICTGGISDTTHHSTQCPAGYYCPAQSSTGIPCPVGRFCPIGSTESILSNDANKCNNGYFCIKNAQNATQNDGLTGKICPAGYLCPSGTITPIACAIGTYNPSTQQYLSSSCKVCDATDYCNEKALVSVKVPCPAGYYCPAGTTNRKANLCPAGYSCPTGSSAAIICPIKTFQPNVGQESCITCLVGYFCDTTGMTTPKLCTAGKYCPESSNVEISCPVGTFSPRTGLSSYTDCEPCLPGYYCASTGLLQPTDKCTAGYYCTRSSKSPTPVKDSTGDICPLGYYCPTGTQLPKPCPPGTFGATSRLISNADCTPCLKGYFCPFYGETRKDMQLGTEYMKCNAGFICLDGSRTASPTSLANDKGRLCLAGYYCPKGSYDDKECALSTFNPDQGQASCLDCPAGFLCNTAHATSVTTKCPVGNYCPSKSVYPIICPSGTYMPYQGAKSDTECVICPPGKYCLGGQASYDGNCAAGYSCSKGAQLSSPQTIYKFEDDIPGKCPVGYFCLEGSSSPSPCAPGTYQPSTGASNCLACPKGKYCDEYGMSVAVRECAAGHLCISGAKHARPLDENTEGGRLCSQGYYCPQGTTRELPCKPASYEPRTGSGSCITCPKGFYCVPPSDSVDYIINPIICPIGFYCPEGSVSTVYCPDGTYGQFEGLESSDQCRQCPAGFYCKNGVISGECEPGYYCDFGVYSQMDSNKKCPAGHYCLRGAVYPTVCPSGTVRLDTGGVSVDECVVCPTGYFCLPGISIPYECPKGYYCPIKAERAIACPVGTYNNFKFMIAPSACTQCPAGYNCYETATSNYQLYPCEAGAYCQGGATIGYCPINYYRNLQLGTALTDCVPCPDGSVCEKVGTINPSPCPPGYICKKGIKTPCTGGYYCPVGTALPLPCPEAFYCPRANSSYYKCPIGTYCPARSENPTPCPSGTVPNGNEKNINKEGSCKSCIEGTYSTINDIACRGCYAGYVCLLGANKPNPTNALNEGGYKCPKGYYCPERSYIETPCPVGTYRDIEGGEQMSDCFPCKAGTFNYMVGQSECQTCGNSSIKSDSGTSCECIGKYRVYQISTKTCICAATYEPTVATEIEDGKSNCQPLVYEACANNMIRDSQGNCSNMTNCTTECKGGNGTRSPQLGICICDKNDVLNDICDATCRTMAPKLTMSNGNIYFDGFAVDLSTVSGKIEGNLTCTKAIGSACKVQSLAVSSSGDFSSDYQPTSLLLGTKNTVRRKLAGASSITNPVMCIYKGDAVAFTVSKNHYPKYCRTALINSIKSFDEGPFKKLEAKILAGSSVENFVYTFSQDGIAVIQDALNLSKQTIIAVMGENKKCPDDTTPIQPMSYDVLLKIGAIQNESIVVSPDWGTIFGLLIMIVIGVPALVLIARFLAKSQWFTTQPKKKPYLVENKATDIEAYCDGSNQLKENSEALGDFALTKKDARITENLNDEERSLRNIRKMESRKLQHEVDPSVFLHIYEELRECVKLTQEKLINRSSKDSQKIENALKAVNDIQSLLESKLQGIVKKYSPNANLEFAHNDEQAHIEVVNDSKEEEESIGMPASKDLSEQVDKQIQQQDLDDELMAKEVIECMKASLNSMKSDYIEEADERLKEELKQVDQSKREGILKEMQVNHQKINEEIRKERKNMEDAIARRIEERKTQRLQMRGKHLEIENERIGTLSAIKGKVDQIQLKEQEEIDQLDTEFKEEKKKALDEQAVKHEQEWDSILASFQGKVANTKDSEKIAKYLDKFVDNYADLRKQMEEEWRGQDEQTIIKVQKRREDRQRQIESRYRLKKEDVQQSFTKTNNNDLREMQPFDTSSIKSGNSSEFKEKLEIVKGERQKVFDDVTNKLTTKLALLEDQYLTQEKLEMPKDSTAVTEEVQTQRKEYEQKRAEYKTKIANATKEEKAKMVEEVADFEKKYKSFKQSETERIIALINDRREERRKKYISMQDAATLEAQREKEEKLQVIKDSIKELSASVIEAKLQATLSEIPENRKEQAIGGILDKIIEEKQVNDYRELMEAQLQEKTKILALSNASLLRERIMELSLMKGDSKSKLAQKEMETKIELDYIGKQFTAEMDIHEKYGKRYMMEVTALKEVHLQERSNYINQYIKDPYVLQLMLASQASLAHDLEIFKADILIKFQLKAKEIEEKKIKIELTNKQNELHIRSLEGQEADLIEKIEQQEKHAEEQLKKQNDKKVKEQELDLQKKGVSEEEKKKLMSQYMSELEEINKSQDEERKRQHQLLLSNLESKKAEREKCMQQREEQLAKMKQEKMSPRKEEKPMEESNEVDMLKFTIAKNEPEKAFFEKAKPITGLKLISKKTNDESEERVADFYKVTNVDGNLSRDEKFDFSKLLTRIVKIESTLGDVADTQFIQLLDGFKSVYDKMDILSEIKKGGEEQDQ